MIGEFERKEYFFPKVINWEEILSNKKLGDRLSITLLDDQEKEKEFNNMKIVLLERINGALFINATIDNDPSGTFYKLDLAIYEDNSAPDKAYLYPTGWPIGTKKHLSS